MHTFPIKICFVIDVLKTGGTEKQLIEIMRHLDPAKFKIYLVCLRNSEMLENINVDCSKLVLNIKSFKSPGIFKKLLFFRSYLIQEQIDIVQTFFIDAAIAGILAAKLAKVKKILSSRRDMGFWYNKKELRKLRFVNRFVDRFLVNSEAIKQNLSTIENIQEDTIDVLYNGVNVSNVSSVLVNDMRKEFKIPDDHIVIACVANFNRRVKRVDIFIQAAAIICTMSNKVSFVVIGDGCLRNELVDLSAKLNMQNRIIFTGQRNDISSLLQAIDIGVLTSDSEGFSNSILEYMAAGIPTVATDVGGNRELIENTIDGLLVPPQNPRLIAEAVLKLINDTKLRVAIGNAAKKKVHQNFSFEHRIKLLENYYVTILHNEDLISCNGY